MRLTFHDRINTQLIYRFELAQVVARRITKPLRIFLGSNLTGRSFLIHFFSVLLVGRWWPDIVCWLGIVFTSRTWFIMLHFFVPSAMVGLRIKTHGFCHVDIYMSWQNQIEV